MIRDYDELVALFQRVADVTGWEMPAVGVDIIEGVNAVPTHHELLEAAKTDLSSALASGDADAARTAHRELSDLGSSVVMSEALDAHKQQAALDLLRACRDSAWEYTATRYRERGDELARIIAVVDADAPPEMVAVDPSKAKREGWASIPRRAQELDQLATLLGDLLRSCRWSTIGGHFRDFKPDHVAVLLASPPELAAEVLRAEHHGRGSRWSALISAGCTLEALEDPRDFRPLGGEGRRTIDSAPEVWRDVAGR